MSILADTNQDGSKTTSGILPNTDINTKTNPVYISGYPKVKQSHVHNSDIARKYIQFTATFFTQNGKQNASYVLGRADVPYVQQEALKGYLTKELLGFTTKNDAQNQSDIPTMTLKLAGMRNWEEVLVPNDYASLGVVYVGTDSSDVQTATLMTGIIVDIHKSYSDGNLAYVVTCQGLAGIMANINLTTFPELSVNGTYLLHDLTTTSGNEPAIDLNSDEGRALLQEAGVYNNNQVRPDTIEGVEKQYDDNLKAGGINVEKNKTPTIKIPSKTLGGD